MIRRINKIKNFGVFKDYSRTGDVQDFGKINVIYGWNYSGKTTLSRVFQSFENKSLKKGFTGGEFELEDEKGNKSSQDSLTLNGLDVRVFNSDFINENIHMEGEDFDPILLIGKESKEARDQIKYNSELKDSIIQLKTNVEKSLTSLKDEIENGLTDQAKYIKENVQIFEAFDKGHLKKIISDLENDLDEYIKPESKVQELLVEAKSSDKDKLDITEDFIAEINLKDLVKDVNELLNTLPEFSSTIEYFVKNPNVANWVEKGLPLHEGKQNCEFCGKHLDVDRLEELKNHFSDDLKKHKSQLSEVKIRVENSKVSEPSLTALNIYEILHSEFETRKDEVIEAINEYNSRLESIIDKIEEKKNKPFEKIQEIEVDDEVCSILESKIKLFNTTLKKNRSISKDFDNIKEHAIEILKKHYSAKYVQSSNIFKKKNTTEIYDHQKDRLEKIIVKLSKENIALEAKISKAHLGKDELNKYIYRFLGRKEIRVDVEKNQDGKERFRLKRSDLKATNLSEGEKTAIAFSFFLTKLKEIENLENVVIYIDDPISSLDSNHIFQVNALLRNYFYVEPENDEETPKELRCAQIFFSTHNFEFFNLLRNMPIKKNEKKSFFMVKRVDEANSIIEKLPKSISGYTSEYHYLFKLIYDFNKNSDKSIDDVIILPNVIRRFVELYSYSRIPGHQGLNLDGRIKLLWGAEESKRIIKVCHYFSHGNSIERMSKHSELICDVENSINDLIGLVSKDKIHYKHLIKSVG